MYDEFDGGDSLTVLRELLTESKAYIGASKPYELSPDHREQLSSLKQDVECLLHSRLNDSAPAELAEQYMRLTKSLGRTRTSYSQPDHLLRDPYESEARQERRERENSDIVSDELFEGFSWLNTQLRRFEQFRAALPITNKKSRSCLKSTIDLQQKLLRVYSTMLADYA